MAQISHLDVGDIWKPTASFTVSGTPTDPTTLTTRLLKPDGTLSTASYSVATLTTVSSPVAKSTTGTFVYSVSLDQAGHWYARFEGTGAATAAEDSEAIVDPSPFYDNAGLSDRALVGLGETKDWLARRQIDTSDDARIVDAINGVSEEMMRISGREFKANGTNPETRRYDVRGTGYVVQIGDLQTMTTASSTISVSQFDPETSLHTFVVGDYTPLPRNRKPWEPYTAIYFNRPTRGYYRGSNVLDIEGYWGFPEVPENVRQATKDAVAFWLDRDVEHFRQDLGVGNIGEAGQTVFVGGSAPTVYSLPPQSYMIARKYQRKMVMG